jgi:hydrogenase maturation factor
VTSIANDLRGGNEVDIGQTVAVAAFSLAQHFARGATLWCVAPQWPEHARHIAVEFVHPVLVGKRALPAVSVDVSNPVATLRSLVRSGDVVLAVSPRDSTTTLDLMRRAEAWGAMTIWMGVGPRPTDQTGDHIIWAEDDPPERADEAAGVALHDGRLVLLYHLLWELTHVCFEHPGLLTRCDAVGDADDEVCITCSDEGRIGEVIANKGVRSAQVRTARGVATVDTTIVEVEPGDLVLIHAGAAIAIVP